MLGVCAMAGHQDRHVLIIITQCKISCIMRFHSPHALPRSALLISFAPHRPSRQPAARLPLTALHSRARWRVVCKSVSCSSSFGECLTGMHKSRTRDKAHLAIRILLFNAASASCSLSPAACARIATNASWIRSPTLSGIASFFACCSLP
jgi:hypothetical protein